MRKRLGGLRMLETILQMRGVRELGVVQDGRCFEQHLGLMIYLGRFFFLQ